jgi:hypothetical protein
MPWLALDPLRIESRRLPSWTENQCPRSWPTGPSDPVPAPQPGELVGKFGQDFLWSQQHWLASDLEPWRQRGDDEVDAILARVQPGPAVDVVKLAADAAQGASPVSGETRDAAERRAMLAAWHNKMSAVPEWVDWAQLERGQEVFVVHAPAAALSLYYLSLVGGFSAPLITRVLRATAYLTAPPKQVMRRLIDTGAMISACVNGGADALRACTTTNDHTDSSRPPPLPPPPPPPLLLLLPLPLLPLPLLHAQMNRYSKLSWWRWRRSRWRGLGRGAAGARSARKGAAALTRTQVLEARGVGRSDQPGGYGCNAPRVQLQRPRGH